MHFIIGFLIALLSGLGIGGGGLFAVYLAVFTNTPQLSIQGFNLLFFILCAGASVCVQLFYRKILFGAVLIMSLSGVFGALGGAYLAYLIPEEYLRRVFGIMLVAGGIISLRSGSEKDNIGKS